VQRPGRLPNRPNHAEVPDRRAERGSIALENGDFSSRSRGKKGMGQPHDACANDGHIHLVGNHPPCIPCVARIVKDARSRESSSKISLDLGYQLRQFPPVKDALRLGGQ
jgi:hypothetical protein